jgi:ribosomal protein S18 acetylase RimI-like enzyme
MKYDIVPLRKTDSNLIGRIIEDGFAHDPICNWVFNSNNSALYPFFSMLCRDVYLREGFGYTTTKAEGVALWVPPNKQKTSGIWTSMKSVALMARYGGLTGLKRGGALEKAMPAKPPEPFYYLFLISTVQAHRGQGLGGMLFEPGLEKIDSESADSYIESSNEKNLSFYRRYGYEIIGEIEPTPESPHMWLLSRPGRN